MKKIENEYLEELVDLSDLELNELEGGSILTDVTQALAWFAATGCKSYLTMHECGLTSYRH